MNREQLEGLLEKLNGEFKIIKFIEGLPIVFLFDENHDNPNNSIESNIENAKSLIRNAFVKLIGVESLAGGKEWDEESEDFVKNDDNIKWYTKGLKDYKSRCTLFVDGLSSNCKAKIYGVESIGMISKIETDVYDNCIDMSTDEQSVYIENHHLHVERSKHFIRTISEEYNSRKLMGNIILNCGLNHNNHIENWVNDNTIKEITGCHFSYVRLNTI